MSTEIATVQSAPQVLATLCDDLTTKQKLFIYYYLEHKHGTRAAKLAGYDGNDATLSAIASENLRKPLIREAIEQYYQSRLLSANGVLAELSDIASSPWREHVEVKYGENGEVIAAQLKLTDKIRAAELVGKHHKLFTEKVETETSLSDNDVERLSQALVAGILEAAAQRRATLAQAESGENPSK